ncbi:SURF1 family protein [Primorskyibacter sp. S87]|uniref:SURF1 family protein n=1 Tax=Primorskyibacter sp. S87 TaxID=3415126 RepID=UPI003C7E3C6F
MRRILFFLIFGLSGLSVLLSLGFWQVRRLEWKNQILAEIEARISQPPVSLPASPDPNTDRFLPVAVHGQMQPEEIHVLVSVKKVGPGYRVISPFIGDDGRRILVDRGFVSTDGKQAERVSGSMEVTGNLHWPQEIDSFTPDPDLEGNIWFAREVTMMAKALDTEPVLVIAKSETDPTVTPLPVDTSVIPNDHWQYAVTWFGLALVWAAMTLYFLWRPGVRPKS